MASKERGYPSKKEAAKPMIYVPSSSTPTMNSDALDAVSGALANVSSM
jgi:hypothetical protein